MFHLRRLAHLPQNGDSDYATLDKEISHAISRGIVHSPVIVEGSGSNHINTLGIRFSKHLFILWNKGSLHDSPGPRAVHTKSRNGALVKFEAQSWRLWKQE